MRAPAVKVSDSLARRYAELAREIDAVVEGECDLIARMASVAAILADSFETYFWTGFYIVDRSRGDQLVVGPYQGTLGCLRIDFGRGVCGAAAAERRTLVVPDVDAFPGHIACDSRSKSEIVVPVFDRDGDLIAVLDVDSAEPAAFSDIDAAGLEEIVRRVFAC
jgi:L-methionine (R)-S-oxide reductase